MEEEWAGFGVYVWGKKKESTTLKGFSPSRRREGQ